MILTMLNKWLRQPVMVQIHNHVQEEALVLLFQKLDLKFVQ
jgi:hypothetical protein